MLGFFNYTVWITYTSLATSVLGIVLACKGNPLAGIICLIVSGFCDAFDGQVARTRTQSTMQEKRFGVQLDSLCDLVCFGVLPVVIAYAAGLQAWYFIPVFILYVLGALIRLAYFNVLAEERLQNPADSKAEFVGLPVTSVTLILPLIYLLRGALPTAFPFIYGAAMLLIAMAFVAKFRMPKPNLKMIVGMLVVGLAEFILLLICGV